MSSDSATPPPTTPQPWIVATPAAAASRPLRARSAKLWRTWVGVLLLFAIGLSVAGAALEAGLTIRDLQSSIASAQAHLVQAEALGAKLATDPFDHALLIQTREEIAAANQDFRRASADADRFAPAQVAPKVGLKVQDARALLDMAVILSDGGLRVLNAAEPVMLNLKAALAPLPAATAGSPGPQASSSLTTAQLVALQQAVAAFAVDITQAHAARQRIPDQGVTLGATAAHLLARYDQLAPTLSAAVDSLSALLAAAPALLGTDHPASYLVEILDETELRGGGGFIGNYGVMTVTGGRMSTATVKDTYLLDGPYLATHTRAFPALYSWFPLTNNLGLRDSNLSPDFPQNAQLAERIYQQESGQSVSGVVAITPAFIAQLLQLTGPVAVPGYPVTVTSQNLVQTIHHYQFQTNAQGVPSSDGLSSTRKHFTAVLGETVFARLRTLPAGAYSALLKLAQANLKSKNLQLYLGDQGAQTLLTHLQFANALPGAAASNDLLALVDNNVGGNKADLYVTQTASDDVTVRADGSAQHTLTLVYKYHPTGSVFGDSSTFADEVQIYVPHGSTPGAASGLSRTDAPTSASDYTVYGGQMKLSPNTTRTVVLRWTTPALSTKGYQLVIDRQAGSLYTFAISIHLPSAASSVQGIGAARAERGAGQLRYRWTACRRPLTRHCVALNRKVLLMEPHMLEADAPTPATPSRSHGRSRAASPARDVMLLAAWLMILFIATALLVWRLAIVKLPALPTPSNPLHLAIALVVAVIGGAAIAGIIALYPSAGLFLLATTAPLEEVLYVSVGGFRVKPYEAILLGLVVALLVRRR